MKLFEDLSLHIDSWLKSILYFAFITGILIIEANNSHIAAIIRHMQKNVIQIDENTDVSLIPNDALVHLHANNIKYNKVSDSQYHISFRCGALFRVMQKITFHTGADSETEIQYETVDVQQFSLNLEIGKFTISNKLRYVGSMKVLKPDAKRLTNFSSDFKYKGDGLFNKVNYQLWYEYWKHDSLSIVGFYNNGTIEPGLVRDISVGFINPGNVTLKKALYPEAMPELSQISRILTIVLLCYFNQFSATGLYILAICGMKIIAHYFNALNFLVMFYCPILAYMIMFVCYYKNQTKL